MGQITQIFSYVVRGTKFSYSWNLRYFWNFPDSAFVFQQSFITGTLEKWTKPGQTTGIVFLHIVRGTKSSHSRNLRFFWIFFWAVHSSSSSNSSLECWKTGQKLDQITRIFSYVVRGTKCANSQNFRFFDPFSSVLQFFSIFLLQSFPVDPVKNEFFRHSTMKEGEFPIRYLPSSQNRYFAR